MEKWECCIQGQGQSKGSECWWLFVWMISSEPQNVLLPNLVLWCSIMSQSVMPKGLTWSKRDSFYYIFWTVDSLATKLGLTIHRHKPECHVEKKTWITAFEGRAQWRVKMLMFVQMISSKPPNKLFSNLVLWCIIISQSVIQRDWFAIFKVKVTARVHMIEILQFLLYLLNCWSFCYQPWFDSTLS